MFKAKVRPEIGRWISGDVRIEIPLERIVVFAANGHRLDVELKAQER